MKGEIVVKSLASKETARAIVLLIVLSVTFIGSVIFRASAAPVAKNPTVYISGSGSVQITWKSGKTQTYSSNAYANLGGIYTVTIIPSHGWHIEALLIDGSPQIILDEDGFTLASVEAKNTLSVTFLENGGVDDVQTGLNVESYPDPQVGLVFDYVLVGGYVYAYPIGLQHPDQQGEPWDIQTNAAFNLDVTVYLVCSVTDLPAGCDPYRLTLWRTQVVLGDVNLDGKVDGTDVSIVANANPSNPASDPRLDLNGDGRIDDLDVTIVSHNVGEESVWEQLPSWVLVDNGLVYVYGVTSHFSVIGIHR
jgi:hypothetical protein